MPRKPRERCSVESHCVTARREADQRFRSEPQVTDTASRTARCNPREAMVHRIVLATVLAGAVVVASAQVPLQADADSMRAKLAFISETGDRATDESRRPAKTSFTEREVNAYLNVYGPTFLPDGLTGPGINFDESGRVAARGIVDLDAVRLSRQRDWLDPMAYMTGMVDFTATGVVTSANGKGVALLESATLAGISVPASVVWELVRYYTTVLEASTGFDLEEPFELPANIERVLFEPGRATVVQ